MISTIHIFRVKAGIKDPDDIIQDRDSLWSRDVRLGGGLLGVLYVQHSLQKLPGWLGFFENAVDFSDVSVVTSSSAAVLLVPREKRLFAVVFGYGRYLLKDEATEA